MEIVHAVEAGVKYKNNYCRWSKNPVSVTHTSNVNWYLTDDREIEERREVELGLGKSCSIIGAGVHRAIKAWIEKSVAEGVAEI